jgi:hypothetical protein
MNVMQNDRTVRPVSETDLLKGNRAFDGWQRGASWGKGGFWRRVQDIAKLGDRKPRLMEVLQCLGEAQHRLHHMPAKHVEGDQVADAQAAVDHGPRPKEQHGRRHQLADQLHALACPVAETQDPEARFDIGGQLLLPAALHLGLYRHRFQRLDVGDALNEKGLVLGAPG